jgi:light-regulated signal transduction histidine kinase (bacteriophytochrome)
MAEGTLRILILDDDAGDRKQVRRAVEQAGLSCECIETAGVEEALEACETHAFHCAIVDYRMPEYDGLLGVAALHQRRPYMAIVMATGQGGEMVATEAMKRGASDYICKANINADSIRRIIENAVEMAALRRETAEQREDLERFAAVLAHDLKAPVGSIQAFARFIEVDLQEEIVDRNKIAGRCRRIFGAGRRMDALIDTLHDYTRAGALVRFEPVAMRRVVEDTLRNLEHAIRERAACVTHGELPAVVGNAPQLTQLLQNLVGNGTKYCAAVPPAVHIAASPEKGNTWLFSVADNGIGIPEACYKEVFEPFKRLHDRSKFEGTGLGLAICKKIVERHGGEIWCKSNEGEGTTFFFTLPGVGLD